MQECILSAHAKDYVSGKNNNAESSRKTLSSLVGHIQVAMRHAFECSAEQPVQRGIPFNVLIAWLLLKCESHSARVEDVKHILHELAQDEHGFFRVTQLVKKANELNEQEMSHEQQIDKETLHECLQLCSQEADRKKDGLKAVVKSSAEQVSVDNS